MKVLFVDTGAFYALADRKDPAYRRARKFFLSSPHPFVTTNYVFAETMSLLTKRLGKSVAVTFGRAILESQRFRVEEVLPDIQQTAWRLFSTHLDKDYDLIDCTSFGVMDALSIEEAFGFDRHFIQYGFRLLPG